MFVWNAVRKTLLLPVTLSERDMNWRTTDYYNGFLSINIDPLTGIKEIARASHLDLDIVKLEAERKVACEPYLSLSKEPQCRELLNGEIYCDTESSRGYVPGYCYKDSSIWSYVGENSWNYATKNIQRVLYIGDTVYSFSQDSLRSHTWN